MIKRGTILALSLGILSCLVTRAGSIQSKQTAKVDPGFRLHAVNSDSEFEAATAFDVNKDGKLDIYCGGYWYEAPSWKKHFVRDVPSVDQYYVDFAAIPIDLDGDGWIDVVSAAWHNESVFWIQNPGRWDIPFKVYPVDKPGFMETAISVDINGDGQGDILPNVVGTSPAWYEYRQDPMTPQKVRWTKHTLPPDMGGHGIGAGDINGDGRCDLIGPQGWLEQKADTTAPWNWHPEFQLGDRVSVPVLVMDVDADGDADLVYGMAHDYGLYWLEQMKDSAGKRAWEKHLIDREWSQVHFLLLADLNGDGQPEVVTGKRYHAHNGRDPGEEDPLGIYAYQYDGSRHQWNRRIISSGGPVGFGINTVAADVDSDGDLDLIAPGKSGLYYLENLRK